jgi:hypothetical protein
MQSTELLTGGVQVRDTRSGEVIRDLSGRGGRSQFSPDGQLLLHGGKVWNLETGQVVQVVGPNAVVFADEGRTVLMCETSGVSSGVMPYVNATRVTPIYLDVSSGKRRMPGRYEGENARGLANAMSDPARFSPDRLQAVDWQMRVWRVPR